jgi:hypothetical protein
VRLPIRVCMARTAGVKVISEYARPMVLSLLRM